MGRKSLGGDLILGGDSPLLFAGEIMKKLPSYKGRKFAQWQVLSDPQYRRYGKKSGCYVYLVQCDCGLQTELTHHAIMRGRGMCRFCAEEVRINLISDIHAAWEGRLSREQYLQLLRSTCKTRRDSCADCRTEELRILLDKLRAEVARA